MTQDCLNSPSTADVSYRLPKGIHVTGADDKSDPAIEGMPWGYLFFHNKTARAFEKEMKDHNDQKILLFLVSLFMITALRSSRTEREHPSKDIP